MDYTVKNLREVEDSAVKFGYGDCQEAHFAREDLDAESTGLAYHVLRPGRRQPFAHRHSEAEEIYVVLSGDGKAKLDDDVIDINLMDAIRVAPTTIRSFEAGFDGLELMVFGAHHKDDYEMVDIKEFWNAEAE